MFVIPSIDLMAGEVVRLAQGKATEKKVYSRDPMACARRWEKAGGQVMHLVDLEGAFQGQMKNLEMIGQIARTELNSTKSKKKIARIVTGTMSAK